MSEFHWNGGMFVMVVLMSTEGRTDRRSDSNARPHACRRSKLSAHMSALSVTLAATRVQQTYTSRRYDTAGVDRP